MTTFFDPFVVDAKQNERMGCGLLGVFEELGEDEAGHLVWRPQRSSSRDRLGESKNQCTYFFWMFHFVLGIVLLYSYAHL